MSSLGVWRFGIGGACCAEMNGEEGLLFVRAPIRLADVGGWTDTWFARFGSVCCLAAGPAVTVKLRVSTNGRQEFPAALRMPDVGVFCTIDDASLERLRVAHPMVAEVLSRHWNTGFGVAEILVTSGVPPGSSLGTSASVGVALVKALTLISGDDHPAAEIAALAHDAEIGAGLESGVQDHVAAAFGGALHIDVRYPSFNATPISLSNQLWQELSNRLCVLMLGRHDSSATHRQVIARLADDASTSSEFETLRGLAEDAANALRAEDIDAYCSVLNASVPAQAALHPDLIGPVAVELHELVSRRGGAIKVNGAGGYGGSISVVLPADPSGAEVVLGALRAVATDSRELLDVRPTRTGVTSAWEPASKLS
jgi:D-glycero-alpha-D-manno-heptose-7-phosphate kinase